MEKREKAMNLNMEKTSERVKELEIQIRQQDSRYVKMEKQFQSTKASHEAGMKSLKALTEKVREEEEAVLLELQKEKGAGGGRASHHNGNRSQSHSHVISTAESFHTKVLDCARKA